MGRHRAPDDDEPADESSDDYPGPEDFGDAGGYREPGNFPADEPPYTDSFSAPRYPAGRPRSFTTTLTTIEGFSTSTTPLTITATTSPARSSPSGTCPPPTSIRRTTSPASRDATGATRPRRLRPAAIGAYPGLVAVTATRPADAASASG